MESRLSLRSLIVLAALAIAPAHAGEAAKPKLPRESLYQVSSKWIDASGEARPLSHLRGSPAVVAMMYPRCKYTCPLIISKLKKIEKDLASKPGVKFVLISFDVKNDTPASFKKFLEEKELDPARWKLLGGKTTGAVREIAALLDTSYKLEKDGEFSHSNVISLLDADGVKRASLNGLNADHSGLVKAAQELP